MRLFDLGIPWNRQYAPETERYAPTVASEVAPRLPQLVGYLSSTAAAVIEIELNPALGRDPGADLDRFVEDQLGRVEAEFSGRLLLSAADWLRFRHEPAGGLTWAIPALRVVGRAVVDDRVTRWIDRGVRIVSSRPPLAGPARTFVELNSTSIHESEHVDASRTLVSVRGRVTDDAELERLRTVTAGGGLIALTATGLESARQLAEAIECFGPDHVGIATRFLDGGSVAGLENAEAILRWLGANLPRDQARAVTFGNAERFFTSEL